MSLINSDNKAKDLVNLLLFLSIVIGFLLFGYALFKGIESAFMPLSGIISTALTCLGVKAYKKTS